MQKDTPKRYQIIVIKERCVIKDSGIMSYKQISERVLVEVDTLREMREHGEVYSIYHTPPLSGYVNPIDKVVTAVRSEIGQFVMAQRMLRNDLMQTIMVKRMW